MPTTSRRDRAVASTTTHQSRGQSATASADAPRLRRDVGLTGLTFVSLGSIIGSGWLLGALTAAQTAGSASLISWVLAGTLLALLALVHAELGAAYPVSGGTARFPHYAFGSLAGYMCGWMGWIGSALLAPVEVEAAITYADKKISFIPAMTHTASGASTPTLTGTGILVATALMVLFTFINIVGVRWLSDSNTVTVIWKVAVPLLTIVALLAVSHHSSNFTAGGGFAPFGAHGVLAALPLGVVFAMQGFEQALQVGGEARNPQKDMARAVLLSMLIGTVIYLLLEVAFIGSLNPHHLVNGWAHPFGHGSSNAPYATIATTIGLGWLATLLYIDAFVSPSGTGLVYTGTSARLAYALGRSRYVPPVLSKVSRRGVPMIAVIVSFVIGEIALLPFPSWSELVTVITSASALMYAFAPVSLMALRRQDPDRERPYRLPMPALLCPLSFIAADLIVYWTGWTILWKIDVALGVGAVLFALNYAVSRSEKRPDVSTWRASLWVLPWLAGMSVIDRFGQFNGGDGTIPFWWDLLVVAAFSLVIFYLAVGTAVSGEQARGEIEDELAEEKEADAALAS
jgi:amino acid transporter